MKKLFLILLYLFFYTPLFAADVTVCDSGGGCDYTTISAAIAGVTDGIANTITVQNTYTANERVTVNKSGASSAARLIITATGTQTTQGFVISDGKDFITINGFTATGYTTAYGRLMEIEKDCDYVTISNNIITGAAADVRGIWVGVSGSGSLPTNIIISGNTISDIRYDCHVLVYANTYTVSDNYFGPSDWGADAIRAGGTYGIYENNTMHNIDNHNSAYHADIIQVYGSSGYPANNLIFRNNLAYSDAMAVCQPCNLSTDTRDDIHTMLFYNNIFVNVQYACSIFMEGVEWYNNVFVNSGWNTSSPVIYSIYFAINGDGDGKRYKTTVGHYASYETRPPTGGNWTSYWEEETEHPGMPTQDWVLLDPNENPKYYAPWTGAGDNGVFKNNVLIGTGTSEGTHDSYGWPTAGAGVKNLTMSNNYVSKPYPTFYSKTGWNTNNGNINGGDPEFVNYSSNDFRLTVDSILKNAGVTIADFSTDKIGVIRPQDSIWDIGPFEYSGEGGGELPVGTYFSPGINLWPGIRVP